MNFFKKLETKQKNKILQEILFQSKKSVFNTEKDKIKINLHYPDEYVTKDGILIIYTYDRNTSKKYNLIVNYFFEGSILPPNTVFWLYLDEAILLSLNSFISGKIEF